MVECTNLYHIYFVNNYIIFLTFQSSKSPVKMHSGDDADADSGDEDEPADADFGVGGAEHG